MNLNVIFTKLDHLHQNFKLQLKFSKCPKSTSLFANSIATFGWLLIPFLGQLLMINFITLTSSSFNLLWSTLMMHFGFDSAGWKQLMVAIQFQLLWRHQFSMTSNRKGVLSNTAWLGSFSLTLNLFKNLFKCSKCLLISVANTISIITVRIALYSSLKD